MECQCDKPVSKKLHRPRNVSLGQLRLRYFLQPPAWHRNNLRHLPLRRSRVSAAFVLAFHSRDEEISDVLTRSIDTSCPPLRCLGRPSMNAEDLCSQKLEKLHRLLHMLHCEGGEACSQKLVSVLSPCRNSRARARSSASGRLCRKAVGVLRHTTR